jgi:hypothetical protein
LAQRPREAPIKVGQNAHAEPVPDLLNPAGIVALGTISDEIADLNLYLILIGMTAAVFAFDYFVFHRVLAQAAV